MNMGEEVIIPIIALSLPIVIVPTVLFFKHQGRKRELQHLERMRAIELGVSPQNPGSLFWPSLAALGIGAGVPCFAILFGFLSAVSRPGQEEIWTPLMILGVASVISGAALGTKMLGLREDGAANLPGIVGKPEFDPDAYDTVGQRG
jgi:hypothetical protein